MLHLILSPPIFPVLPRLVIGLCPIGGGAIRSGLDSTPRHCAQYAQAQDNEHNTCHHVQASSMTSMSVEAGRDAVRDDLRLCIPCDYSSWRTNFGYNSGKCFIVGEQSMSSLSRKVIRIVTPCISVRRIAVLQKGERFFSVFPLSHT